MRFLLILLFTFVGSGEKIDPVDPVITSFPLEETVIVPPPIVWDSVTATVYYAVPGQTDDTPLITADGSRIKGNDIKWVALSRDMLSRWGGPYNYGDTIAVVGTGYLDGDWVIHDCMNARYTKKVDFLIPDMSVYDRFDHVAITPKHGKNIPDNVQ